MKKLLQKVSNWLRSRVTAITKVKGERLRNNGEQSEGSGQTINGGIVCTPATPDSCTPERNGERSEPLLLLIEEFIDEHYRVRLNTLSQQYEVCERGTERWVFNQTHFSEQYQSIFQLREFKVITHINSFVMYVGVA